MENEQKKIREKYDYLKLCLNEKQRRLYAGVEARTMGYGGIEMVSRATGLARNTVKKGKEEIENNDAIISSNRVRREGGGRNKEIDKHPEIKEQIEKQLDGNTIGDPMSPITRTTKSLTNLSIAVKDSLGAEVGRDIIARFLKENGYSLQGNKKIIEGGNHIDRDAQFLYIQNKSKKFIDAKIPVLSVDTKKKELVGNFKNSGKVWCKKGQGKAVNVYDFPSNAKGKAVPYGVYDIANNNGWVSVGVSADTGEFSVQSIRNRRYNMGKEIYSKAKKIYINCDGGGSNGSRCRLRKIELQKFANEIKKEIHVSHFPPGTSKWNKIEHKLFCHITQNWKGKPLDEFVTIVNLISNTKTSKGLVVKCSLDENIYQKGIKISDECLAKINIKKDRFHGEWNYTISPQEK